MKERGKLSGTLERTGKEKGCGTLIESEREGGLSMYLMRADQHYELGGKLYACAYSIAVGANARARTHTHTHTHVRSHTRTQHRPTPLLLPTLCAPSRLPAY